jgi:methyl-accepting chemotaxis protein
MPLKIYYRLPTTDYRRLLMKITTRIATVIAFAISILVSFLILRSISKPLANLTEGTRALMEGKLFYRLDTSGKDELAQLAKDFNSLARRLNELEKQK